MPISIKNISFCCCYNFGHDGSVYLPFINVGEVPLRNCCICLIYILGKECQSHVWIFLENDINSHFQVLGFLFLNIREYTFDG
jgi:hypothetical protein